MAALSKQDLDLLQKSSGINRQEALALLNFHKGNVRHALIDLEQNGMLKPGYSVQALFPEDDMEDRPTARSMKRVDDGLGHRIACFFLKVYTCRVLIEKENTPVINFSFLFSLLCLLLAPHMVLLGALGGLFLGYRITIQKQDETFTADSFLDSCHQFSQTLHHLLNASDDDPQNPPEE